MYLYAYASTVLHGPPRPMPLPGLQGKGPSQAAGRKAGEGQRGNPRALESQTASRGGHDEGVSPVFVHHAIAMDGKWLVMGSVHH